MTILAITLGEYKDKDLTGELTYGSENKEHLPRKWRSGHESNRRIKESSIMVTSRKESSRQERSSGQDHQM